MTGHYPTDPAVAYDNDRICEDWNDLIGPFGDVYFKKAEDRPALVKDIFSKAAKLIESLKPFLENKTSGFLFGDKPMTADFWMANLYCTHLVQTAELFGKDAIDGLLAPFPWFKAYGERCMVEFKSYLESRPVRPA